jgi:hypothetical protein
MIWCRLRPLKELIFSYTDNKSLHYLPFLFKVKEKSLEEKKNLQSLFKKGHNFKKITNGKALPLPGDKVFWTIGACELTQEGREGFIILSLFNFFFNFLISKI